MCGRFLLLFVFVFGCGRPSDARVAEIRAVIYRERAKRETSLMAKGIFNAAARDCAPGPLPQSE